MTTTAAEPPPKADEDWDFGILGRYSPRRDPYRWIPLVRIPKDEGAARRRADNRRMVEANRCAEKYQPGQRHVRKHAGPRRNVRQAYPDLAQAQRNDRECAQLRFRARDPRTGKTVTLAQYILRVEATLHARQEGKTTRGGWQLKTGKIADVEVEVPEDPVVERKDGVNSREAWQERLGGDDECVLVERPIWEALDQWSGRWTLLEQALAADEDEGGWHLPASEHDPAEVWAWRMDRRETKLAKITEALAIGKRATRLPRLDALLNAFSVDGDPAHAEELLELVCHAEPGYLAYCHQKVAGYHRRGRKPRAAGPAQERQERKAA